MRLGNADITVVCERPKIGPHADAMRANLAEDLGVDAGRISIKATTTERLGLTGRGEGIAAMAVALLVPTAELPRSRRHRTRGPRGIVPDARCAAGIMRARTGTASELSVMDVPSQPPSLNVTFTLTR